MRIAVLADIHGNAAALDAVLEDLAGVRPDRILLNGDLLAFGPEPAETVALLRRLDAPSTRGNTDRWLAEAAHRRLSDNVSDEIHESLRWTLDQIGAGDLRAFTDLPFALAAAPLPALLFHASGAGDEQGVWPDTPAGEIPALFASGGGQTTFVVSHTHIPGERTQDDLRVWNTGSVGLPLDADPRACYLLLEGDEARVDVSWRRVAYDRERTLRALDERNVPMAATIGRRLNTAEF